MCLSRVPPITLVSVVPAVEAGDPLDLAALVLDGATGIVRYRGGSFAGTIWSVRYSAGRVEVPPTISLAARILLQHLWRTQYGASRGLAGIGDGDDFNVTEPIPGFGYAVPNRVLHSFWSRTRFHRGWRDARLPRARGPRRAARDPAGRARP
ncbi:hypothetical protein ACWD5R_34780 [Streptomyces sp. NPDC002514]|uniref:hypothetical protein n=1 Tax=Streptomyces sp. NPDC001270 TaxID=3364554 RepID=UPI003677ADDD